MYGGAYNECLLFLESSSFLVFTNFYPNPFHARVLDYDTYSAHDAIGKVYIDLNPLLTRDLPCTINGWFPIYDTMHGNMIFIFFCHLLLKRSFLLKVIL